MLDFKKFNTNFFKGIDKIRWYDRMGLIELNKDINAEIEISTAGMKGHYKGYWITIISKKNGEITRHFFGFDLYFKRKPKMDKKVMSYTLLAIQDKKKDSINWIVEPNFKDITKLVTDILEYIKAYN